ncbi:MAG: GAF domain-containing protein, partial [Solirubrobacteraceae bacterium]
RSRMRCWCVPRWTSGIWSCFAWSGCGRVRSVVPLRLGDRVLGALTLVSADSGRALDQADVSLAEELASRAAVAIENARLYSQRTEIAHTLQQSLLPQRLPEIPG